LNFERVISEFNQKFKFEFIQCKGDEDPIISQGYGTVQGMINNGMQNLYSQYDSIESHLKELAEHEFEEDKRYMVFIEKDIMIRHNKVIHYIDDTCKTVLMKLNMLEDMFGRHRSTDLFM
jgi:hypothetical protein